jgi:hypothetical protein
VCVHACASVREGKGEIEYVKRGTEREGREEG